MTSTNTPKKCTSPNSLPRCSAPLIFENDLEGFLYASKGTGFLVRYHDAHYFVTAKHNMADGDHNRLRVPRVVGEHDLLDLLDYGSPALPPDEIDTDYGDFVMFSVGVISERVDNTNALVPAKLADSGPIPPLCKGERLTVRGFPKAAPGNYIDYDRNHMSNQAVVCDAEFMGPTESRGTYELQFVDSCPVKDIDGMSGAPVFVSRPSSDGQQHVLVGMMLRAKRFLAIEVVRTGIDHFLRR